MPACVCTFNVDSCTLRTWRRRRSTSSGATWPTSSSTPRAATRTPRAATSFGAGEWRRGFRRRFVAHVLADLASTRLTASTVARIRTTGREYLGRRGIGCPSACDSMQPWRLYPLRTACKSARDARLQLYTLSELGGCCSLCTLWALVPRPQAWPSSRAAVYPLHHDPAPSVILPIHCTPPRLQPARPRAPPRHHASCTAKPRPRRPRSYF